MNNFSRVATALLLASSLFASSIRVIAQSTQTQEPAKTQAPSKEDKKKTPEKATSTSTSPGRPLAVNENPDLIGKRNINKGIIAGMSGSTEKEVRLGRELAAEVDRQAKFVDDPHDNRIR